MVVGRVFSNERGKDCRGSMGLENERLDFLIVSAQEGLQVFF